MPIVHTKVAVPLILNELHVWQAVMKATFLRTKQCIMKPPLVPIKSNMVLDAFSLQHINILSTMY